MASSIGASILNALIIIVLDYFYKKLATMMVNWENHKYADDWENSLITKNFSFKFVNSNIALLSTAFYVQDFNTLAQNLAVIQVVKQIAFGCLDILVPLIKVKYGQWILDKKFKKGFHGKIILDGK